MAQKIQLKDENGDLLYPITSSDVVYTPEGESVTEHLANLADALHTYANDLHIVSLSKLRDKADISGTYKDMTVGHSAQLLGVDEVSDGAFTFRPTDGDSSIKDGLASIESVKGNSVIWNQIIEIPKSSLSKSANGVTFVDNRDGSYDVMTDSSGATAETYISGPSGIPVTSGNKYLMLGGVAGGDYYTYHWYVTGLHQFLDYGNGTIFTAPNGNLWWVIQVKAGTVIESPIRFRPRLIDLTKMFGAGREPATVKDFLAQIPVGIDTCAYNAGEIINMKATCLRSVGFNAWDEVWEIGTLDAGGESLASNDAIRSANFCRCVPGIKYYCHIDDEDMTDADFITIHWYDSEYNHISSNLCNRQSVSSPYNAAFFKITTGTGEFMYGSFYQSNICVNLAHTGYRNGDYEPYKEETLMLPTSDLFPDGMSGIGDVCDEYTDAQKIQRIGKRDYLTGDEDYSDRLTDKVITYYILPEPIVTPLESSIDKIFNAWDFGTEEICSEDASSALRASIAYEFNARDTIRNNRDRIRRLENMVINLQETITQLINNNKSE